ncbi:ATP-grasp domain-containing protein [Mucilaginibacter sp. 3215]|uniref:ATP-grasp domain-containing protein n=1 Tax=Mucilaginibacter sp. 3215 TaxID=3373912 RepID=UPI003D1E79D8
MKKIGILFGQEDSFPQAFVDRVNQKAEKGISAEFVRLDKVMQAEPLDYAVIIDRISQDVPYYRAALKNAAICGTAVINNPFWWSADEKFFNNALAVKIGVPVPKTVILPSKELPDDTTSKSFRNLAYPLDWNGIFNYVGFPAYMKPFDGGGWKEVYKVENEKDFFSKYDKTKQYVMMLQEEVVFDDYFRCYCIGGKHVRIMQYEPRNPHHLRYEHGKAPASKKLLDTIKDYVIKLNQYLGYDFNTVEFAVRDGIPYAIDFCNPAPDAEVTSVGQENFDWVVETAASYAIERAKQQKDGLDNLTWGEFVKTSAAKMPLIAVAKKATVKADVSVAVVDHAIETEGKVKKATVTKAPAAKAAAAKEPAVKAAAVKEPAAKAAAVKEKAVTKPKKAAKK